MHTDAHRCAPVMHVMHTCARMHDLHAHRDPLRPLSRRHARRHAHTDAHGDAHRDAQAQIPTHPSPPASLSAHRRLSLRACWRWDRLLKLLPCGLVETGATSTRLLRRTLQATGCVAHSGRSAEPFRAKWETAGRRCGPDLAGVVGGLIGARIYGAQQV